MDEVKLLGAGPSFPCVRIVWALKLKGVSFEFMEENLLKKSDLLMKMNPVHNKVPVLIHNNKPISESLVILEYIDEIWNSNPLLPQDPYDRALARFWAKFIDEKVVSSSWEAMRSGGEEKAIDSARQALGFLEKQIEGKKFFNGDRIGYLDLVAGWMSLWLDVMEELGGMKILEPEQYPSLAEWTHNFVQVPTIHENSPPRQDVVDYFQGGLNYLRSLASDK